MQPLTIRAEGAERQYWSDLWRYRELFAFLAWRDLLVRYKQTVVGVLWALIRPVLTMAILVVFGTIGKLPSDGVPYPLLVFAGLLPWQFFSSALSESGASLVNNSNLISKVYFPRLIVPISSVITSFADFAISACFLALLFLWYRFVPSFHILFLPFFLLMVVAAAIGVSLWIAALMVSYRDFKVIVPFITQFGLYLSPVGFSSSLVPAKWRLLFGLNPMAGVIDGFRWSLLGSPHRLNPGSLTLSVLVTAVLLTSGIWYFRKTESDFADVI